MSVRFPVREVVESAKATHANVAGRVFLAAVLSVAATHTTAKSSV